MKVLVTGITGQLGYDVVKELKQRNIDTIGTSRNDFDLTSAEDTKKFILSASPDVVIHCAAYTAVDKAEDDKDTVFAINSVATESIAKACKEIDAKMLYISTDYVFDGSGQKPNEINDKKAPLGIYGLSKLKGEEVVKGILEKYFIVRISWVFGINGNNFIKTMLRIGKERNEVNVVSDQIGSPTYTVDLAKLLCDMVVTEKYGVFHATNEGFCSWAELAEKVFELAGYKTKVNYITTEEYPTKATRPHNSKMSKKSLDESGFERLPDWKNAVERYLLEIL